MEGSLFLNVHNYEVIGNSVCRKEIVGDVAIFTQKCKFKVFFW